MIHKNIIFEGNTIYEIDPECMRKKEERERMEKERRGKSRKGHRPGNVHHDRLG